jgi:hypothetical protein
MKAFDIIKHAASGMLVTAAVAAFSLPAAAQATLPSYATGNTDETIHGTIAAVNGARDISVRDDRGFVDHVTLHQGTIINPTGLTLAPGQKVTILGQANGQAFSANQIDTPYHSYGVGFDYGYPYYGGYAYGFRPYPVYGFGFGYGRSRFGFGF